MCNPDTQIGRYFKFFLAVLVLFFYAHRSAAQLQEFAKFEHYNSLSGLPQNEVISIVQDSNEYIWLGTQNGLARFDGKQFIVINKATYPDLGSNRIGALLKNDQGILLHPDKDFHSWYRINKESNNLEPIHINNEEFYINNKIFRLDISHLFNLRENSRDSILARDLMNKNGTPFLLIKGSKAQSGYIIHRGFVYYYANGTAKYLGTETEIKTSFCLKNKLFIIKAPGKVWAWSEDGTKTLLQDYPQFKTHYISAIFSENDCFFQSDNDLYLLDYENGKFQFKFLGPDMEGHRVISVLYLRNIETIYIGTVDDGLYIYKKRQFNNYFRGAGTEANLTSSNVFYALMPYHGNSILTDNGYFDSTGKFYPGEVNTNPFFLYNNKLGYVFFERKKRLVKMEIATSKVTMVDTLPATLGGIDGWTDGSLVYAIEDRIYLNQNGKIQII